MAAESGAKIDYAELIGQACLAREKAYAPYSGFCVGAALLAAGKEGPEEEGGVKAAVFTGCNIENAAFTPTNCAERTAFFKAVSEGVRSFRAIAVVGGKEGEALAETTPCGVCRQVMAEFCDPDTFEIITAVSEKEYRVYKLRELLPKGFGPGNLKQKAAVQDRRKGRKGE